MRPVLYIQLPLVVYMSLSSGFDIPKSIFTEESFTGVETVSAVSISGVDTTTTSSFTSSVYTQNITSNNI